jgi:hypothetical protein
MKKMDHTDCFEEKRRLFAEKLGENAENCDHNIDPRYFAKNSPNDPR